MCVLAAASCHAASRLFGESESVISPDPALRGRRAPPAISPEPQRLNGQVIDARAHTPTHTHAHNLPACLSISSPAMGPHCRIKATFPWSLPASHRESLTSLYSR